MSTNVKFWEREVKIVNPADDAEAIKVGGGIADKIRRNAAKLTPAAPTGCKLLLSQARYIGTKQEAYSDDSYYAIPFEGGMTPEGRKRLAEMINAMSNGFARDFDVDLSANQIIVREYCGIGD